MSDLLEIKHPDPPAGGDEFIAFVFRSGGEIHPYKM
jgi:hypothetical protein